MKILIGADLVPTQSNIDLFAKADAKSLVGEELLEILQMAEYCVCNLETPLTDVSAPIGKCGPSIMAPTKTIAGIKALGINVVTVANNHIMDQGVQGFQTTLSALNDNDISFIGGGNCLQDAAKPIILEADGKKIGVYACAEHEFSIAGDNAPGANPFDPLESLDHVKKLKSKCDYCIVLYHGGKEHYRYPSPNLQKTCRKLIDKGADLVLCQHSHCIGCGEKYKEGTIVYGQGNFLFDYDDDPYEETSLLVQLGDDFAISYLPLVKARGGVRLAKGDAAERILSDFAARSKEIQDPEVVVAKYMAFVQSKRLDYLVALGGKESFLFRVVNKLTGNVLRRFRMKRRYNRKTLFALQNYIDCEAHRELLAAALAQEQQELV